jgi:hypothetical protein
MTRRQFRDRLAVLEEHRRHRRPASEVTHHIIFADSPGERNVTIAQGPNGFVCHRLPNESFEEFKLRADIELLALRPRAPAGLIFSREEA